MDVCVLMLVKIPERVDYPARFLRCCSTIEVNQRMAVRLFAQDGEILAKGAPIHTGAGNFVHPIICSTRRHAPLYSDADDSDGPRLPDDVLQVGRLTQSPPGGRASGL